MAGAGFTVAVEGGELAAERWPGPRPTVVLLHAGVADRRSWHGVATELAGRFELIAYDRRGFGRTAPGPGAFTHAEDLLALLDAVAADPVWLVGSSAGGGVAMETALLAPHRVAGLVLLAPGGLGPPTEELDPHSQHLDDLYERATSPEEINRLEVWMWLDGPSGPEGRVGGDARVLALEMNAIPLAHDVAEDAGDTGIDLWARRAEIAVPTVIACGDLDAPWLIHRSRVLAEELPEGRYVEWPGVAHLPYLEDPGLVAGLIARTVAGQA
jgi:pimeloyl-ACP methyl ester carboxylesterase